MRFLWLLYGSAFGFVKLVYEYSEQARAPHTNGPRGVPRYGALSLLQKPLQYKGLIVVLRPLFAAALVVRRRYLIMVLRPFPAAPLVVRRRCLIVFPRQLSRGAARCASQVLDHGA